MEYIWFDKIEWIEIMNIEFFDSDNNKNNSNRVCGWCWRWDVRNFVVR